MICRNFLLRVFLFVFANHAIGQSILQYSTYEDLRLNIAKNKEHIAILNFWATWCKPCVAELPEFEKIKKDFEKNKVEVILANLDFHSKTEPAVPDFIKKNNLQSKVVHITDQDANDWIDQVDSSWTGSIPVTAIYFKGEKIWFFEGPTDYETLKSIIIKYIQQ